MAQQMMWNAWQDEAGEAGEAGHPQTLSGCWLRVNLGIYTRVTVIPSQGLLYLSP